MVKTDHIVKDSKLIIEVFVFQKAYQVNVFKKLNVFMAQSIGRYTLHAGTEDLDNLIMEFIKKKQVEYDIPDRNVRIIDRMKETAPKGFRMPRGK